MLVLLNGIKRKKELKIYRKNGGKDADLYQPNSLFAEILKQFPYKNIGQKVNLNNIRLNNLIDFENLLDTMILKKQIVPNNNLLQKALIIANSLSVGSEETYILLNKPQNITQLCQAAGNIVLSHALSSISTQDAINFLDKTKTFFTIQLKKNPFLSGVFLNNISCIVTSAGPRKILSNIIQKNYGLQFNNTEIAKLKTSEYLKWNKICNEWDKKYGTIKKISYHTTNSMFSLFPALAIGPLMIMTFRHYTQITNNKPNSNIGSIITGTSYFILSIACALMTYESITDKEIPFTTKKLTDYPRKPILRAISHIHHQDHTAQSYTDLTINQRLCTFAAFNISYLIILSLVNNIKYK